MKRVRENNKEEAQIKKLKYGHLLKEEASSNEENPSDSLSYTDEIIRESSLSSEEAVMRSPSVSTEEEIRTVTADSTKSDMSIFEAAKEGNVTRMRKLVEQDHIDVNLKDDRGFSVLHHAVISKQTETVDFLIEAGVDVNITNSSREEITPLHYAVGLKNLEITKKLLDAGADITVQTTAGYTVLHEAAQAGNVETIRLLLATSEGKGLINLKNDLSWTALDSAIESHSNNVIKILLEHKATIGNSLLHAAFEGETEACKLLIKAGADVNAVDEKGRNSLHHVCLGIASECSNNYSLITALEFAGVKEIQDNAGNLPKDLLGDQY